LLAGVAVWSLGTFIGPAAAKTSFFYLCLSRVLVPINPSAPKDNGMTQVGLAEGVSPSAATSVLSKQVPAKERSRAVTTVFGGLDLGQSINSLFEAN